MDESNADTFDLQKRDVNMISKLGKTKTILVLKNASLIPSCKLEYFKYMYNAVHEIERDELYFCPKKRCTYLKWCSCKSSKNSDVWMGPYETKNIKPRCCTEPISGYRSLDFEVMEWCLLNVLRSPKEINNRYYCYSAYRELYEAFKKFTGLPCPLMTGNCNNTLLQSKIDLEDICDQKTVDSIDLIVTVHSIMMKKLDNKYKKLKEKYRGQQYEIRKLQKRTLHYASSDDSSSN